jgi:hypothetical protein
MLSPRSENEEGKEMRTSVTSALLAVGIGHLGSAYATDRLGLEPCINGAVSANGRYETQALEDRWTKSNPVPARRRDRR